MVDRPKNSSQSARTDLTLVCTLRVILVVTTREDWGGVLNVASSPSTSFMNSHNSLGLSP